MLSTCRKVFSAGASHYGVADCELLAQETHKFESRYLDSLIGCVSIVLLINVTDAFGHVAMYACLTKALV